jgi:hypothetical protein
METLRVLVSESERDPEGEDESLVLAVYDPDDPRSVHAAEKAIMRHFSLSCAPAVCGRNMPAHAGRLLRAWERLATRTWWGLPAGATRAPTWHEDRA